MFNRMTITAPLLMALATQTFAQEAAPFRLAHYGNARKMLHMKETGGVADLAAATAAPHPNGVAATAHGPGEITPLDSVQAVPLATAAVFDRRDVAEPCDLNRDKISVFMLAKATSAGIDAKAPFPVLSDRPFTVFHRHVDAVSVRAGSVLRLPVNWVSSSESTG